jgi:hypothetical protein
MKQNILPHDVMIIHCRWLAFVIRNGDFFDGVDALFFQSDSIIIDFNLQIPVLFDLCTDFILDAFGRF